MRTKSAAIINADPNVEGAMVRVQSSGAGANSAHSCSSCSSHWQNAHFPPTRLRASCGRKLGNLTGISVFVVNPPSIRIGGRGARSSYQYTLQGLDLAQLQQVSTELVDKLKTTPGFVGVNSDFDRAAPAIDVKIDRDRAATLGVTPAQIESAMGYAFGGREVSQIYASADQYQVILELLPRYQRNVSSLKSLYITGAGGKLVPLSAVTTITTRHDAFEREPFRANCRRSRSPSIWQKAMR